MKKDKFIEIVGEALERDIDSIDISDKFRDYEEWDSFAVLSLLAVINEEYDIIIPRLIFEEISSLIELIVYIEKNKEE